jgi:hypothetical protein
MFSLNKTYLAASVAMTVVLLAGCKSSQEEMETGAPAATASAQGQTNAVRSPPDSGNNMAPNILAWDATEKTYHVRSGDMAAPFAFNLTNVSSGPVMIYDTSTTCDCTVASLPSRPWVVPSGGTGVINAVMDLRRKSGGIVTTHVIVFTSQGNRRLTLQSIMPQSAAK